MSTCPLPSTHMVKNLYSSSTRAGDQGEARRLPSSHPQHDRMTLFYSSAVASYVPVSAGSSPMLGVVAVSPYSYSHI